METSSSRPTAPTTMMDIGGPASPLSPKPRPQTVLTPNGKRPRIDDVPRGEGIISPGSATTLRGPREERPKKIKRELSPEEKAKVLAHSVHLMHEMNGCLLTRC